MRGKSVSATEIAALLHETRGDLARARDDVQRETAETLIECCEQVLGIRRASAPTAAAARRVCEQHIRDARGAGM